MLAGVDAGIGPIVAHGAILPHVAAYRAAGVALPPVLHADDAAARSARGAGLVLVPPSALAIPWLRRFGDLSTAFASGWMQIPGVRRRRALDRGFVLSDHADWGGILEAVRATGAERVAVTHGYASPLARYLRESGLDAWALHGRRSEEEELPGCPARRTKSPAGTPRPRRFGARGATAGRRAPRHHAGRGARASARQGQCDLL
ncbi:MAG: hypothetical protein IT208_14900 [Chthonomonadales bacterium]|nr:hypothetical protein [Chthonomonadales bacterium]